MSIVSAFFYLSLASKEYVWGLNLCSVLFQITALRLLAPLNAEPDAAISKEASDHSLGAERL